MIARGHKSTFGQNCVMRILLLILVQSGFVIWYERHVRFTSLLSPWAISRSPLATFPIPFVRSINFLELQKVVARMGSTQSSNEEGTVSISATIVLKNEREERNKEKKKDHHRLGQGLNASQKYWPRKRGKWRKNNRIVIGVRNERQNTNRIAYVQRWSFIA